MYKYIAIRNNLYLMFKKKQIRSFINPTNLMILFIRNVDRKSRLNVKYRVVNKISTKNNDLLLFLSKTLD